MQIIIYSPSGSSYDVTSKTLIDDTGEITLRLEDNLCTFVCDDLSISFDNRDNYFSNLWSLPLDPTLKYNEGAGSGCWNIKIIKISATRFIGDLDTTSVIFDAKEKIVKTTWFGKSKRAEVSAEGIKRNIPNPLTFTSVRGKRVLTFPNQVSTYNFLIGDRIRCSALRLNGNIIDQELEIKHIGASSNPPLTAYQVKVRQGCRKAFTEGYVKDPYYKSISGDDLTVAECVTYCFDALGIPSQKQIIIGSTLNLKVDVFETKDKSIADCLNDLARYAGAVWFCDATNWYFIQRNDTKTQNSKNISNLVSYAELQSTEDEWYDNVKAVGTPPAFAPNSKPRQARYGVGKAKTFKIETKYTSSLSTLQNIAQTAFAQICKQRKKITLKILDDGTAYNIWDRIYYNNEYWTIIEVREPLRGLEYKEYIDIVALSETGSTPSGTLTSFDENEDDDPPYPPSVVELGKGTDNPANRPAWWSEARTQYPAGNNEFPIKRVRQIIDDDNDPKTPPKVLLERLWFVRWQNEFNDDDDPDGFEITVFNPSKGIEKPLQHHGYRHPKKHSDGYYYFPLYLACKTNAPEKCVVIRTFIAGRDLAAYSDEVSTEDWGGSVEDNNPFADITFTVTKLATDDYTLTFQLAFTATSTGSPKVISELEKIKICKSEASATSPDLNRKQPPLDCLDYSTSPPKNTRSEFKVVVPHKKDVIPRVWFRPVSYDGQKMDWTYDSTSGGGGTNAAPNIVSVRRVYATATGYYLETQFNYAGEVSNNKIKIWIQTNSVTGNPESGTGWAATCPNILNLSDIQTANGIFYPICLYYNDNSTVTSVLPTSCNIIAAVYNSDGTRISEFSTIYNWIDLAQSIPQPSCAGGDMIFNDANDRLELTWKWATAFTGYAYAITYHQADTSGIQPLPTVPSSGVMTTTQFESASQYQTNANGKTFALVDFGETGHKYKTLTNATSLLVYHPVGTETPSTLYATCALILFKLDGTSKIVWGNYGARNYYGSDYITFPDFTLEWITSGTSHSVKIKWLNNGSNYYIPIQQSPANITNWANVGIVQGTLVSGYRTYTLTNCSSFNKYRFRLATTATYGTEIADTTHSAWKTISYTGGGGA